MKFQKWVFKFPSFAIQLQQIFYCFEDTCILYSDLLKKSNLWGWDRLMWPLFLIVPAQRTNLCVYLLQCPNLWPRKQGRDPGLNHTALSLLWTAGAGSGTVGASWPKVLKKNHQSSVVGVAHFFKYFRCQRCVFLCGCVYTHGTH